MKPSTSNSIGAALSACAEQAPVGAASRGIEEPPLPRPCRAIPDASTGSGPRLTPRQFDVLALLCEGLPNKLICRRLDIALGTVKIHISSILRGLGVTTRLQAVLAAYRLGLLAERAAETPAEETAIAAGGLALGIAGRAVPAARYHDAVAF